VWGHHNNINVYKNAPCSPCLDLLSSRKCPYGNKRMNTITVEEVKTAILAQINRTSSDK
jgi:hypothetical protein